MVIRPDWKHRKIGASRETSHPHVSKDSTLATALQYYAEHALHEGNLARSTVAEYRRQVQRFSAALGRVPWAALTSRQIAEFLATLSSGVRPSAYRTISAVLRWLDAAGCVGLARAVPTRRPVEAQRHRHLSDAEYEAIWQGLHDPQIIGRRLPSTIRGLRLMVLVPLRRGDVVYLRWDEVDLPGAMLRLRQTKEGKQRTIPLPSLAVELLSDTPRRGPWVFPSPRSSSGLLDRSTLSNAFREIATKIGLRGEDTPEHERIVLHGLRHSWASKAVRDGWTLDQASRVMGHASIYMTEKYAHLFAEELRPLVEDVQRNITDPHALALPEPPMQRTEQPTVVRRRLKVQGGGT